MACINKFVSIKTKSENNFQSTKRLEIDNLMIFNKHVLIFKAKNKLAKILSKQNKTVNTKKSNNYNYTRF